MKGKVQVINMEHINSSTKYLDPKVFDVKYSFNNIENKPTLISVSNVYTYLESDYITTYFKKSVLKPYGLDKVKAFPFYTRRKMIVLDKIEEYKLSLYNNPIYYSSFAFGKDINMLLENIDNLPDKLVIKYEIGAKGENICFVDKDMLLDTLHLISAFGCYENCPIGTFNNLKPLKKKSTEHFERFLFSQYLYVEEDLSDRIFKEYRALVNLDGDVIAYERIGYGDTYEDKKTIYLDGVSDIKSLLEEINISRLIRNMDIYVKRMKEFVRWMDTPIISIDIVTLDNCDSMLILEASGEYAFKRFPPMVAKEFINKSYIKYCKEHRLL